MRNILFLFLLFSFQSMFAKSKGPPPRYKAPSDLFITGDTFRYYADHIYDDTCWGLNPAKVKAGDIIFIEHDRWIIERFFKECHPYIKHPYIIINHNNDYSVPGLYYNKLDSPKIIAWFGQNIEWAIHPKLVHVPIGLANICWTHGNVDIWKKYLKKVDTEEKSIFCYVNINLGTYQTERCYVNRLFKRFPWVYHPKRKPFEGYLDDLIRSKYVVSPRGNGLDCHRTWEAMLMGAIPIVRSSFLDPVYEDLPVLIVDNWEEVTEELLLEQYDIIRAKPFNKEKLFFKYWWNLIQAKAAPYRKSEP